MDNCTVKEHNPLPLVTYTMTGRELRETYIDQRLHKGWSGFHNAELCSPYGKKKKWNFPY